MVKNLPANTGDVSSMPKSERSPEGGNNRLLQYSCLENPSDPIHWIWVLVADGEQSCIIIKVVVSVATASAEMPVLPLVLCHSNGGGNDDNGDLLPKAPCMHCCMQCP